MTDEKSASVYPGPPSPDAMAPQSWEPLPHKTLPRPNFFPAGLAMGITFTLWGLITSWVILAVGIGLFAASLAGWIYEIVRERNHH